MKGTREHIKGPNGQSSTMILCLISNGRLDNLASFSLNSWPVPTMIMSPYNGKGNVEGGHEEITKSKVGNEEVGDGVKPACLDDYTEDKEVTKERYNDEEAIDNHDEIVQNCKLILEILY